MAMNNLMIGLDYKIRKQRAKWDLGKSLKKFQSQTAYLYRPTLAQRAENQQIQRT